MIADAVYLISSAWEDGALLMTSLTSVNTVYSYSKWSQKNKWLQKKGGHPPPRPPPGPPSKSAPGVILKYDIGFKT